MTSGGPLLLLGVFSTGLLACAGEGAEESEASAPPAVSGASGAIVNPAPDLDESSWVRAAKDYASWRYSTLAEITTGNVSQLRPAWTFSTGVLRGQEAFPLVVANTMYIVTPFPNVLYVSTRCDDAGSVSRLCLFSASP